MRAPSTLDVSVVVPFADHEDRIGAACTRLAGHLRALGLSFEVLAVDEDSTDNSHNVLRLLRTALPELRVIAAIGPGRGFALGASQARGRILWLLDPIAATLSPLGPFWHIHQRIARRELDLAIVDDRFAVLHRTRCFALLANQRIDFRRLARRARQRGLAILSYKRGGGGGRLVPMEGRWLRLWGALASARVARTRPRRQSFDTT
jgi:hypothetical protein